MKESCVDNMSNDPKDVVVDLSKLLERYQVPMVENLRVPFLFATSSKRKGSRMNPSYRNYDVYDAEEIKEDRELDDSFVLATDVKEDLDSIEDKVNEIRDILKPIRGLDIIDEAKEILDKLSEELC